MKHFFISLIFSMIIKLFYGQIIPSSCTASDAVKAIYRLDSKVMAAERMFMQNNFYTDSVNISRLIQDSIMGALLAVHNAVSLPARDSVVNMFKIHVDSNFVSSGILVKVDTNYLWVKQWMQGISLTGNAQVDTLMIKYKLSFGKIYYWSIGNFAIINESVPLANYHLYLPALVNQFKKINGVLDAEVNSIMSIGPPCIGINYRDSLGTRFLTYLYADSCGPVPCLHLWKFKIYPGCSVEYLGSSGCKLSIKTDIAEADNNFLFSIYPNPASEQIVISNNTNIVFEKTEIKITDLTSRTLLNKTVLLDREETISLKEFPPGIYFLNISYKNKQVTKKVIKN